MLESCIFTYLKEVYTMLKALLIFDRKKSVDNVEDIFNFLSEMLNILQQSIKMSALKTRNIISILNMGIS